MTTTRTAPRWHGRLPTLGGRGGRDGGGCGKRFSGGEAAARWREPAPVAHSWCRRWPWPPCFGGIGAAGGRTGRAGRSLDTSGGGRHSPASPSDRRPCRDGHPHSRHGHAVRRVPSPPLCALPRSGGGFPSVVGGGGGACDGAVGAAPTAGSDRVLPRSAQPRCAPSQAKGLQGAGGGVPAQQTVWRRPPWAAPRALTEQRRLGGARRPRWRGQKAQVGSAAPIERSCTVLLCVQRSLPEAPSLPFGRQCHQHLFEANQD